ncbi:alkaline protease-like protein [Podospora didyma]|uniref:Alkaline protease-like protein n=1 Tax=Podospora didyma TaxID=330526 RepID=A0AAE0K4F6_9PEZI|nr:alkaline protease-like protein [Podospora didyma]
MHFSTAILALLPLALAAPAPVTEELLQTRAEPAPVILPREGKLIPGKYIVKLKDGASDATIDAIIAKVAGSPSHVYKGKFKGFASKIDAATLAKIQALNDVEFIEQEAIFTTNTYVSQTGAPWGLGRISHHAKGSTTYVYDNSAGVGTCSYVIDTGILVTHTQFGSPSRATWLANYADSSNTDGNGHGTHVAGTIGGSTYGVAKLTKLYAVKVLDSSGSGTTSGVVAGINFVASDAQTRNCPNGTVANMSLGGSFSTSINSAASALISSGVFLAVAAGNSNANAANYSPASVATACTVGATDINDAKASFSNYGAGVDIWAPGVNILSSWIGSNSATNTISGTSMASPHIAGLGAYLLTLFGPKSPTALCTYIQSIATNGVITGLPTGNINKLAFNNNPTG